jgi:hypothetical protein
MRTASDATGSSATKSTVNDKRTANSMSIQLAPLYAKVLENPGIGAYRAGRLAGSAGG